MPQYLSPGVFVEEVDAGSRPIEGVGTAVAAFVGVAAQGPLHEPTLVSNWTQFTSIFGEFVEGSYLAHSVYGYFMNGGGQAYVVRIGGAGAGGGRNGDTAAQAELPPVDASKPPSYRVTALEAGPGGNEVTVEVSHVQPTEEHPDGDRFNLVVRRSGQLVEVHEGLSTRRNKANAVTAVREASQTIKLEAAAGSLERPAEGAIGLLGGNVPAVPERV